MRALCDVVNRRESVGVSKIFALHQQAQKARPVPHRPIKTTSPQRTTRQASTEPRWFPSPAQPSPDQTQTSSDPSRTILQLYPSTLEPPALLPRSPKRPTNQPSTLSHNPPPNPLRPHPNIRTQIQRPPQPLHLLRRRRRHFPSHRRRTNRRHDILLRNHNLGILQHGDRDDERGFRSRRGGREEE